MSSEFVLINLQEWRQKSQQGTLTREESKAILERIRADRVGSSEVSAASREKKSTTTTAAVKKVKAGPVDSQALLAAFMSKG